MREKKGAMLSSQKSLNFSSFVFPTGYPHLEYSEYAIFMQYIHFQFQETPVCPRLAPPAPPVPAAFYAKYEKKSGFPHYPQSYPQKKGKKAPFSGDFPFRLWITFSIFQLIHIFLRGKKRFCPHPFPSFFRSKYENNINYLLRICNNFVLDSMKIHTIVPFRPLLGRKGAFFSLQ